MSDGVLGLKMEWTIGPRVLQTGMLASEEVVAFAAGAVEWSLEVREWCDWFELWSSVECSD